MAIDMNALRAKAKQKNAEKTSEFIPIDLNEGNVQAIFNRCLAKTDSEDITYATLFPTTHGYKPEDGTQIQFDTAGLLKNRRNIEYLFGQLQEAYEKHRKRMSIDDYNTTYQKKHWTNDKGALLKFLYLGVNPQIIYITPFRAESSTSILSPEVKPTLSPKDPNFPAWWEAHKGEWEA